MRIRTLLNVLSVSRGVPAAARVEGVAEVGHGGGGFSFGDVMWEASRRRVESGSKAGRRSEILIVLGVSPVSVGMVAVRGGGGG